MLLVFQDGTEFTNEDISIEDGFAYHADFNGEKDLTLGLTPSAQIRFVLYNNAQELAEFEFGTFVAYIGAEITDGTPASGAVTRTYNDRLYEFAPLGTFIADRPDVVAKETISVMAFDQMQLFDTEMPATLTGLTYPTTLVGLLTAMCNHLSVPLKTSTFLNSTLEISKKPDEFANATMRDVLRWIAEAAGSIARFTRDGELEMAWFSTVNKTFNEGGYSEFTPSWYEVGAVDGLRVRNASESSESVYGSTHDNDYIILGNPFLR